MKQEQHLRVTPEDAANAGVSLCYARDKEIPAYAGMTFGVTSG